jgi:hypothetical protein
VRHSLNIIVAMLSMAAGAWQGTTAHTEQPAPAARHEQSSTARQVTLNGCVHKGQAPGTFLLTAADPEAGVAPASAPAAPQPDAASASDASASTTPAAQMVTYELVSGRPDVDLATLVGKRVEARGTPERTAPGATADDSPTAAAADADTPSAHSPAGTSGHTAQRTRVRITTVRSVAGACE